MKKSKLKKWISLAVALVMLLLVQTAAFAQQTVNVGTGAGSIKVTNATEENTYRLYKLFDATYDSEKNAVAYSFTKTTDNTALFNLLTAADSPFELTEVETAENEYVVQLKEDKTAQDVRDWVSSKLAKDEDGKYVDSEAFTALASVEATDSELLFSNLAFGYYFLTSTLGASVTINSNTPDVEVIDKNQGPSWDVDTNEEDEGVGKVILSDSNKTYTPYTTENSVNVGDTVNFKIGVNTTNYNGENKILEYFINDTLGKGFEIDKTSLTVSIGETELTKVEADPALNEYTVKFDDANNKLRITIPWYDAVTEAFASESANNQIYVTYSATLKDNASTVYGGLGNKNTATFDYRDDSDTPNDPTGPDPDAPYHESDERETTTYTFALGFLKIDGKTKEKLANAEFKIKNADGKYLVAASEGNGVYLYTGVADTAANGTTFVTTADGKILVKGVAEGTYTVIETKAPNGYNKLTGEKQITASIASATTYSTTYTTYYDANGNVVDEAAEDGKTVVRTYEVNAAELVVENNKGIVLPDTGGIGTKLFYLAGGILVIGAVVLVITKRRMKGMLQAD